MSSAIDDCRSRACAYRRKPEVREGRGGKRIAHDGRLNTCMISLFGLLCLDGGYANTYNLDSLGIEQQGQWT